MKPSFHNFYSGRRIFLTGHTGFKGGWLAVWLRQLGAEVHGYSLAPPTEPNLFHAASVFSSLASDTRGDLANLPWLRSALACISPEIVFHLAAQPLVLESYRDPLTTFRTNILGTANLLEAIRAVPSVRAVVLVTTDKVYANYERNEAHKETDPLGGHDPYSASKASAELVVDSYRKSFFSCLNGHSANLATVRAGNAIGGGDWGADRLIPNCVRAFLAGRNINIRTVSSWAVRPWQHVLEPLSGYLELAKRLYSSPEGVRYAKAWNFGPQAGADCRGITVAEVAEAAARLWGGGVGVSYFPPAAHPYETGFLCLDSTLAREELGWGPRWELPEALKRTVSWYKDWQQGKDMREVTLRQIREYEKASGR